MTPKSLAGRLNAVIDGWLTAPEPNAAGRLGLFRILYSAFYLWLLSFNFVANLSGLPAARRRRILLIEWLPTELPPAFFELLEAALVAALVLLMVGLRVRLATLVVLVIGCILEAFLTSADPEYSSVLLVFYIPAFVLLTNARWGHTYSLDALLRRRAGKPPVDPSIPSGPYFLPARAVLVVLSMLFLSAAVLKVAAGGTWLVYPSYMANLLLKKNVDAAIYGLPLNPLAPVIASSPLAHTAIRYQVLLFEALFVLGLFNRKLRSFFLALALVFHAIGGLWLVVTFTPVLIVYALFVDWQELRHRLWPTRLTLMDAVPSRVLVWSALSVAVVAGALWNVGGGLRAAVNLGGLLNWRTIWYPLLPVALIWWLMTLLELGRSAVSLIRPSPRHSPGEGRDLLPGARG